MRLLSVVVEPLQTNCPSTCWSGQLSRAADYHWKHAPNIFLVAVVATMMLRFVAQTPLGYYKKVMFGKIISLIALLAFVLLVLLVTYYSPSDSGPVGILAVFFLLYIIFVGIFTALIRWSSWIVRHIQRWAKFVKGKPQELSVQKSYYLASVVALGPVMLIGIGSVGHVGWYEVVLIGLFVAIGYFYIEKRS